MPEQPSFSGLDYQGKKRKTHREEFLDRLEAVVPWQRLEGVIRPQGVGTPPLACLGMMLRVRLVQVCHNLSDPAMEDLLYDSRSVQQFVGLSLPEPVPDESTILHFRHPLERHQLGQGLFEEIKAGLVERGLLLKERTIVDATIIQAPSSTKNKEGKRDPEMRQTRKGQQYYFGMTAHIEVYAQTGVVHSLVTTGAKVHDVTQAGNLLHGEESWVWGDAGYTGVEKRPENLRLSVEWLIALKPGQRRLLEPGGLAQWLEQAKASVRAKVEHPFLDVKRIFGYAQVWYRGLAKNHERLAVLLGLSNLLRVRKLLLAG